MLDFERPEQPERVLVLNKADLLPAPAQGAPRGAPSTVAPTQLSISCATGQGLPELLSALVAVVAARFGAASDRSECRISARESRFFS